MVPKLQWRTPTAHLAEFALKCLNTGMKFRTAFVFLIAACAVVFALWAHKKAAAVDYGRTAAGLIDRDADAGARELYGRLRSEYGKRVFSGQTNEYFDELAALAGKMPVMRGFDMQNYSPHNPWGRDWKAWDDGTVRAAINWHKSTKGKGIVAFHWHWFSPSSGKVRTSTFNTKETGFDVSRAVVPGNREYKEVIRDIDAIAAQLKRLRDAGVPVLWRPLHEAGGGWFWWGAKGPEAGLKLYALLYDRLTNYHRLHNLIWVWATPETAWYPGNDKVDIAGYDSYPGPYDYRPQKEMFGRLYSLVKGEKLIAMSENGPVPYFDAGASWSFFVSWGDLVRKQNTAPHLRNTFEQPGVITLENY